MSQPVRQHLVPRCYLNKFAVKRGKKKEYYLDAYDMSIEGKRVFGANTRNICVINEFYTFDHLPEREKRWLEKYYANQIEVLYDEIYNTLVNPEIQDISSDLKLKILVYIISQELRTDKITKALNTLFGGVLEYSFSAFEQFGLEKKIGLEDGTSIDLDGKTLEEAKKESFDENRRMVNLESVRRIKHIAELKMQHPICVKKYSGDIGLITSDRPVIVTQPLYSPSCILRIPIDKEHLVTICPREGNEELNPLTLHKMEHKGEIASLVVTTYNMAQLENADRFIFGHKNNIERTLQEYSRHT